MFLLTVYFTSCPPHVANKVVYIIMFVKNRIGRREAADQLVVALHVPVSQDSRHQTALHALQGYQAPDREGTGRRRHRRGPIFAARRPAAAGEDRGSQSGELQRLQTRKSIARRTHVLVSGRR